MSWCIPGLAVLALVCVIGGVAWLEWVCEEAPQPPSSWLDPAGCPCGCESEDECHALTTTTLD